MIQHIDPIHKHIDPQHCLADPISVLQLIDLGTPISSATSIAGIPSIIDRQIDPTESIIDLQPLRSLSTLDNRYAYGTMSS